jgi:hypothetical protein
MAFKAIEQKVVVDGKQKTRIVHRDGVDGNGVTLPFTCAFCKDKGKITAAFRSRRQRNAHTQRCPR